ncbi:hypothetical protein ACIP5U_40215, partial [Streptomyces sp. NPDC088788]|uniref:hypothetical protein n=1 Tax=Streptomyces sp. NPDC088788 TaxID=3365898 RepID=UPI0037F5429A
MPHVMCRPLHGRGVTRLAQLTLKQTQPVLSDGRIPDGRTRRKSQATESQQLTIQIVRIAYNTLNIDDQIINPGPGHRLRGKFIRRGIPGQYGSRIGKKMIPYL